MNILVAIDSFYGGGAEIFAIRFANGYSNLRKDNIYFTTLRPWLTPDNHQFKLLDHKNVEYIGLTGNRWFDLVFKMLLYIATVFKLNKLKKGLLDNRLIFLCKSKNIDIVNSHSYESDFAFAMVKARCKFKLVTSFHGHYELFENSWKGFEESCEKLLKIADAIVYLSPRHQATLDRYNVPVEKRHKIFYGFELNSENEITTFSKSQTLKLLMVARGIKEKGWEELLLAVRLIHKNIGNVVSVKLIGDGEYLNQLKDQYSDLENVEFLGFKSDVIPYVKESHICLLPSFYKAESLPNSVIEYLMCGKPVITTDVGAIPEMIKYNDETGGVIINLIEEKVSELDIYNAIVDYLNNPNLITVHSEIALKASEKFRMSNCVDSYHNLFIAI